MPQLFLKEINSGTNERNKEYSQVTKGNNCVLM